MNPEELSRQELEDLYDAAIADKAVFRAVTSDSVLWAALSQIARDRKRARYGERRYRLLFPVEWATTWLARAITALFRGRL